MARYLPTVAGLEIRNPDPRRLRVLPNRHLSYLVGLMLNPSLQRFNLGAKPACRLATACLEVSPRADSLFFHNLPSKLLR